MLMLGVDEAVGGVEESERMSETSAASSFHWLPSLADVSSVRCLPAALLVAWQKGMVVSTRVEDKVLK